MQITENQYKFAKVRHDLRNDIESRRECTDEDNHGLVGCVRACVANTIAAFGWYLFSLFLSVLPILLFLHSGTWYQELPLAENSCIDDSSNFSGTILNATIFSSSIALLCGLLQTTESCAYIFIF